MDEFAQAVVNELAASQHRRVLEVEAVGECGMLECDLGFADRGHQCRGALPAMPGTIPIVTATEVRLALHQPRGRGTLRTPASGPRTRREHDAT